MTSADQHFYLFDRLTKEFAKDVETEESLRGKKVFDNCYAPYGGRFDCDSHFHTEKVCGLVRYYRRQALGVLGFLRIKGGSTLPSMPPVYLDFVDNAEINASATWQRDGTIDQGLIGLNTGTLLAFRSFFLRALALPNILDSIGNVSEETALPILMPPYLDHLTKPHLEVFPKDPRRYQCAILLTRIAMDFLVAHEFAHLRNGHVRMLQGQYPGLNVAEIGWISGDGITPMVSQAWEMDADAYATNYGAIQLFGRVRRIEAARAAAQHELTRVQLEQKPDDELLDLVKAFIGVTDQGVSEASGIPVWMFYFYESAERSLELWTFAIHSIFLMLEHGEIEYGSLRRNDHPAPQIRSNLCAVTLFSWIGEYPANGTFDKLKHPYMAGVRAADAAYLSMTTEDFVSAWSKRETIWKEIFRNDGAGSRHKKEIYRTWREIHPVLEKLAYTQDLPLSDLDVTPTYAPKPNRPPPKKSGRRL